MERHPSGRGYGKSGPARFAGPSEAAKKGAIGLVIRSVGTDSQRSPHTGITTYEKGVVKIPAAVLSNPDADQLLLSGSKHPQQSIQTTSSNRDICLLAYYGFGM